MASATEQIFPKSAGVQEIEALIGYHVRHPNVRSVFKRRKRGNAYAHVVEVRMGDDFVPVDLDTVVQALFVGSQRKADLVESEARDAGRASEWSAISNRGHIKIASETSKLDVGVLLGFIDFEKKIERAQGELKIAS